MVTYLLIGIVVSIIDCYISFKDDNTLVESPWLVTTIATLLVIFWPFVLIGYLVQIIGRMITK